MARSPAQTASDNTEPIRYSSDPYLQGGASQYARSSYSTGSRFSDARPAPAPSYSWRERLWQKLAVRKPGPHPLQMAWPRRALRIVRTKLAPPKFLWPLELPNPPPPTRLGLHRSRAEYAGMRTGRKQYKWWKKQLVRQQHRERVDERISRSRQAVTLKDSRYVLQKRDDRRYKQDGVARDMANRQRDEVARDMANGQRKLDIAMLRAQAPRGGAGRHP